MIPINDLSRNSDYSQEFFYNLEVLIRSGQFINGKYTKLLEESLENYTGIDFVIGVASGTAALDLAFRALELPENSGVVLAANAGGYARIALNQNKLRPFYVDVDVDGLIKRDSLEKLKSNLQTSIRAIVVTYLYGQSSNLLDVWSFAKENGLILIEDCAQSIGARTSNYFAGSVGDISTFSFYPTKNLGAIGDAGAVATSNALLAKKLRSLKQYGWGEKYAVKIENGTNQRIDEIQAFTVNEVLKTLESKTNRRRQIWGRFNEAASKSGLQLVGTSDESFVAHLGIIDCLGQRSIVKKHLNESGISTDIHYPIPDHKQNAWLDKDVSLPETERQSRDFLTIPLFPNLTEIEISQICRALEEVGDII